VIAGRIGATAVPPPVTLIVDMETIAEVEG
jgi:hypothetical protein